MRLRQKAIIGVNVLMLVVSVCVGLLAYSDANHGFDVTLGMKAAGDLRQMMDSIDARTPGDWSVKNDTLYKGTVKVDGNFELADRLKSLSGDHVTIFRGDTRVATSFQGDDGKRPVGTKASAAVVDQVLTKGDNFTGEAEVLGNKYLCGYMPIKDSTGKVIGMLFAGIPTEQVESVQSEFIRAIVLATVLLLLLTGALSWFMLGRTLRPLELVGERLLTIADGNFRGEDLTVTTSDEIGDLAHSANTLRSELQHLLISVASTAEQLAAASQQLTASATDTTRSVQQVADGVMKMAEGAGEQANELDTVAAQTEDMGEEMRKLLSASEEMRTAAMNSRTGAEKGRAAVGEAVEAMSQMTTQMAEATQTVDALGERSKEIGKIVETISAIAEQTNLLALNAAIEAARAGEAGRGFSVVADEVRKLAEQSGSAAQDIAKLIGDIQKDNTAAMDAMGKQNVSVQTSSGIVNNAGAAFMEIDSLVNELYGHIELSMTSINQATTSGDSVRESVQKIRDVSQDVASNAQTISAATEEQASIMHEISDASNDLAQMAQKLQDEVAKFKI